MHFNQSLRTGAQGAWLALALLAGQQALAQNLSHQAAQPVATERVPLRYQSALAGYQRYADSRIESWTQSNQTVQEAGGWRAYAKERSTSTVDQQNTVQQNLSMPTGHSHGEHK